MAVLTELDVIPGWAVQRVEIHPGVLAGYKRLAGAVVLQAVRDARGDTLEASQARCWLESTDAALYFEVLNISRELVFDWLDNGMPMPEKRVKVGTAE